MAIDIAHDLDLDQEETFAARLETGPNLEDLASFRAFVSSYYLITTSVETEIEQRSQPDTDIPVLVCKTHLRKPRAFRSLLGCQNVVISSSSIVLSSRIMS